MWDDEGDVYYLKNILLVCENKKQKSHKRMFVFHLPPDKNTTIFFNEQKLNTHKTKPTSIKDSLRTESQFE